jgi:hypothetical protein
MFIHITNVYASSLFSGPMARLIRAKTEVRSVTCGVAAQLDRKPRQTGGMALRAAT